MPKFPVAAEAFKMFLTGKKIEPKGKSVLIDGYDEPVMMISMLRGHTARIDEEVSPKKTTIRPYSKLNVGEEITGRRLCGFTADIIGPNDINKGGVGRTAAHTGQWYKTEDFTFIELLESHYNQTLLARTTGVDPLLLKE